MTSSEHPTSRLRIQFGLRSLLMAVAFVAVLLSWWTDHRIQLARIAALEREVTQLEGPHLLGHFPQRKPEVIKTCPNAFAAFRDGSKIVCANGTHAELWEMTTAQKLLSMAHPDLVLDVSISPDDRSLLTISAGKDAPVRLWDLQDGKLVREYSSSFNSGTRASPSKWKTLYNSHVSLTGFGFTAVAFSPTGRRFATGCEDGTLIVWDTKTAKETARIAGKAFRIRSIAFSPDETKIVTSSQDHTIQIWNVADAALLGALHDSSPSTTTPGGRESPATRPPVEKCRARLPAEASGSAAQRPGRSCIGWGTSTAARTASPTWPTARRC
jgi:hypothetical protein